MPRSRASAAHRVVWSPVCSRRPLSPRCSRARLPVAGSRRSPPGAPCSSHAVDLPAAEHRLVADRLHLAVHLSERGDDEGAAQLAAVESIDMNRPGGANGRIVLDQGDKPLLCVLVKRSGAVRIAELADVRHVRRAHRSAVGRCEWIQRAVDVEPLIRLPAGGRSRC